MTVKKFLESRIDKEIEVICEGASIKGRVLKIDDDVLHLEKDDVICYVNLKKIVVIWDVREKKGRPPGFHPLED